MQVDCPLVADFSGQIPGFIGALDSVSCSRPSQVNAVARQQSHVPPNALRTFGRELAVSLDAAGKRSLRYTGCFLPQNTRARRLAWLVVAASVRPRNARPAGRPGPGHRIATA